MSLVALGAADADPGVTYVRALGAKGDDVDAIVVWTEYLPKEPAKKA